MNGYRVVVLDSGFVYVGYVEASLDAEDRWLMAKPRNIRRWGTTRGLGQLTLEGPTEETVLDDCAPMEWHQSREVHRFHTDPALWESGR